MYFFSHATLLILGIIRYTSVKKIYSDKYDNCDAVSVISVDNYTNNKTLMIVRSCTVV